MYRTLWQPCLILLSVSALALLGFSVIGREPRGDDQPKPQASKPTADIQPGSSPLRVRQAFLESFAQPVGDEGVRLRVPSDRAVQILPLNARQFEVDRKRYLDRLSRLEQQAEPFVVIDGREQYQPTTENRNAILQRAVARGLPIIPMLTDAEIEELTEKCLMIRHLGVVEDEDRTTGQGPWTFGHLMTQMANRTATGIEPAVFVRRWLRNWEEDRKINSDAFTVPNRAQKVRELIITPWEEASGGAGKPLDLTKAPFRLLAIISRLDLRGNLVLGEERIGGGGAGEARFVFCAVDATKPDKPPLAFTVILEYRIKRKSFADVREWAEQWYALKAMRPGSARYNRALERITDQFTKADADPESSPNRSALGQLRTNEIALGDVWELREFRIDTQNAGYLEQVTVKQNPDSGFNDKPVLAQFANSRREDILAKDHRVPVEFPPSKPFLGGAAPTPPDFFWKAPSIDPLEARHLLSLATCNGCHAREAFPKFAGPDNPAGPSRVPTHFTHVRPRNTGEAAQLSPFLTGKLDGKPYCLEDPAGQRRDNDPFSCGTGPVKQRHFHDLSNRAHDLDALVNYGAAYEATRKPLQSKVH